MRPVMGRRGGTMTRIRGGPAPSREDILAADRIEELARTELERTRAQGKLWRDGLAALITLISASAIVKGRDTAKDLDGPWKYALGSVLVAALVCALVAAIFAMMSAYGPVLQKIPVGALAGLNARQLSEDRRAAGRALHQLRIAIWLTLVTVLFLISAVALTFFAPSQTAGTSCIQLKVKNGLQLIPTPAGQPTVEISPSNINVVPC